MNILSGQKSGAQPGDSNLSEDDMEKLEEQFGLQESIFTAYFQWLGVLPRKMEISKQDFKAQNHNPPSSPTDLSGTSLLHTRLVLHESGREIIVTRDSETTNKVSKAFFADDHNTEIQHDGWNIIIESPQERGERWAKRLREVNKSIIAEKSANYSWRAIGYKHQFNGLLQGTLGKSYKYNESVWDMILERIPVSLYFGILSAIITYSISIPLGIIKAIKHKSLTDNVSSILIFLGYSIPGFALGAVLIVYLGAHKGWFPLYGLTSTDFKEMSFFAQMKDLAHHSILPLLCYVISSFAVTTMMMKNNLMDHLSADYIRTAMAKGISFKSAVFNHAFRNSFIPIASTLGGLLGVLVSGSMLIERVFDIQGFGLLSYQALMDKDYTLIMGTLLLASILMVVGNILSDLIVALVDPRVKFE